MTISSTLIPNSTANSTASTSSIQTNIDTNKAKTNSPSVPRRIQHRRRASQPAFSFAHSSATSKNENNPSVVSFGNFYPTAIEAMEVSTSTSSVTSTTSPYTSSDDYTSGEDSEEDSDDDLINWHRVRSDGGLEYLDLSLSLPYRLVSAKSQILAYLTELESRVRKVCSSTPTSTTTSMTSQEQDPTPISPIQLQLHKFHSQLDGFKEDLRRLVSLLPTPPTTSFSFPLRTPTLTNFANPISFSNPISSLGLSASVGVKHLTTNNPLSLASEWERLFSTLQSHLPNSTANLHFAPLIMTSLTGLPSKGSKGDEEESENTSLRLLEKLQARFELLQDSVSGITLRGFVSNIPSSSTNKAFSSSDPSSGSDSTPDSPNGEVLLTRVPSSPSFSKKLELKINHFSSNAQHAFSNAGSKAREKARDTEEVLYLAALELAGAAGRGKRALIEYRHLPTVWKNNEHILSGYRFIPIKQWPTLIKSTFELHNETWNIHTHLWGILIVLPLLWPSKGLDPDTTPMDRLVQTLYLCAAIKCLFLSVSWHIMSGCSDVAVFEKSACLDFVGIAWLISASVWTLVYNAFYCQPNLAFFYSMTTFFVGLVGAILPWAKWFNTRKAKPWRIVIFLTMCFAALAPFTHATFQHGFLKSFKFFSPILPSLAFYIGGLVFYALQWPEKSYPGKFDLGANSHVIWHIAIVLAILFHYRAALEFHRNRFEFSCAFKNPPISGLSNVANKFVKSVGGLHGVEGLMDADERIHQGRIALGKLGYGRVGMAWDTMMEWIQTW